MTRRRRWIRVLSIVAVTIAGIVLALLLHRSGSDDMDELRARARIVEAGTGQDGFGTIGPADGMRGRVRSDIGALTAISAGLEDMAAEMAGLQRTVGLEHRGYYTSDEHDAVAALLFRYLGFRESLWDIVLRYSDTTSQLDDEQQARGFVVGLHAALLLYESSSRLVETFYDEPAVIEKLNENFHDYGVPRNSFDRLFEQVTSVDNAEQLALVAGVFEAARRDEASTLSRVLAQDDVLRAFADRSRRLLATSTARVDRILDAHSLALPGLRNRMRQSQLAELTRDGRQRLHDEIYRARGTLFERVSRLRQPGAQPLHFRAGQVEALKQWLRPGDIILTFSAGYMSNIFLPGMFKHGITYVGTAEERQSLGLGGVALGAISARKRARYLADVRVAALHTGGTADLIEAVAEGVVFNSLDRILATHVNRLVVLRPRLSEEDRVEQLKRVFLLLGGSYDFHFDFTDASHHCCTEVIYRSLHGGGPIELSLTPRLGIETLSADDIVQHYVEHEDTMFSFVAYAEEAQASRFGRARVFIGPEGESVFRERWAASVR